MYCIAFCFPRRLPGLFGRGCWKPPWFCRARPLAKNPDLFAYHSESQAKKLQFLPGLRKRKTAETFRSKSSAGQAAIQDQQEG